MTNEDLLRLALRGAESDWETVHGICEDRDRAEALARLLEQHATSGNEAAEAWAHVLSEMHSGLRVDLRPASSAE